ncbi:MAG TPA: NAD(P)/FAD-dependent oxidoreductase [Burkholderiales bacterium]|nr:NAD(P)/FAD-dependent oxidoreductase [Burkholderiales bacterium]
MRQIAGWLEGFGAVLARNDVAAAAGFFDRECYWRDLLAFTWTLKTCEGREEIKAMLGATLAAAKPSKWTAQGPPTMSGGVSEGWFTFETAVGRGIGHLRLKGLKCWTLLTSLQELKGHEERAGRSREFGVAQGAIPERKSWLERRQQEEAELGVEHQPYVVIVGGGQAGIALAARLRRMGVPNIVLEKNERPGDSWRKRYRSLVLHDPVWYDHLPYLPFPDHWPVFSPKDKMGDWLEMYAKVMELNYWSPALCTRARYDAKKSEWEVSANWEGKPFTLRPKHLVLATGMSGVPNMPEVPGADSFRGRICHSSQFDGGAAYRDEHCVVVGANNSAHDIAADLWEHGAASVTMLQRSPTVVVTSGALMEHAWGKLYSQAALEAGISTEIADLTAASVPFRVLPGLQKPIYDTIRKRDAKLYEGLEKAGFLFHFGEDGSGVHTTYMRRGAGYYIDVGASQMIIDGRIKLKTKVEVEKIGEKSVTLSDGTELPADLIVFATGYGSMNGWAEQLISKEVADKVGKVWGLGSGTKYDPGPWVGELRNMWKPTPQRALWFHGGNLMQARHYSLYLALQLKARMEGIPTPVYGSAP